jgi:hypothetical protein
MNNNWAEQNLQVIRTLMERSALYQRALAPILRVAGAGAVLIAVTGLAGQVNDRAGFVALWLAGSVVIVGAALWLTRRQALRDREPFWSAPTRRVAEAVALPLVAGALVTAALLPVEAMTVQRFVGLWATLYGCALHAAGFFAPRALKRLGLVFAVSGACVLGCPWLGRVSGHALMAVIFGGWHLMWALWLTVTNRES